MANSQTDRKAARGAMGEGLNLWVCGHALR
jgi:hypothetical protein